MATATIEALEQRLALLEDERAILRNLHAYPPAIDHGGDEAWADCFTEDGIFDSRGRDDGTTRVLRGREALIDFARHFARPPARHSKHLILEPLIHVDGDSAQATSYFAVLVDFEDRPCVWVFGRYTDTLARCADGKWRFSKRIAQVESADQRVPLLAYTHRPEGE
jgi:SnoaL-like domain